MVKILYFSLLLTFVHSISSRAADLELSIRTDEESPYDGRIWVEIKNSTDKPIIAALAFKDGNHYVWYNVYDADGERVRYIGPTYKIRFNKTMYLSIDPGDFYTHSMQLKDWYDMPAGKYKIDAVYSFEQSNCNCDDIWIGNIVSNDITIQVN